jgi:hypothetical protein
MQVCTSHRRGEQFEIDVLPEAGWHFTTSVI